MNTHRIEKTAKIQPIRTEIENVPTVGSYFTELAADGFWHAHVLAVVAQEKLEAFAATKIGNAVFYLITVTLFALAVVAGFYSLALTPPRF